MFVGNSELYKFQYVYFSPKNSFYPTYIFNRDVMFDVMNAFEDGHSLESEEVNRIVSERVSDEDLWEIDMLGLKGATSRRKRKFSFAKKAWGAYTYKRNLIEIHDEYYVVMDVPHGEMSDGTPRKYTVYRNLEAVKKKALEYIDSQIEWFEELKGKINEQRI